ncbi:hypothetical protein K3F61_00025 [Acinetobacter baumannii]|uniref:hypothetical protein n=1 Tax=Acinetobacter baumannii TaxID=470 RepID=UPI0002B9A0B7|nr:hypothetical protein [Acinetobacter baumannii]EKW5259719.1 hypothetical protein [Acinetobacter baumannii]EKX1712708.1 hypothetical protein [Acinetobacter baumannii]ELN5400131.1 hypothetical protein [Acinetobacter baumannii]MBD0180300.1 hypothetical protein [Acinetobacter baumannii]MBV6588254.1 hypothetical protein [Acinetobacter baumannii]
MQTESLNIWGAAKVLTHYLPFRSQKAWYRYLYRNPRDYLNQDGYKINVHVINGERRYTKLALAAFITAHRNGNEQQTKGLIK